MRTYYLDIGSRTNIPVKAENISNLRRNIIRDYDSQMVRDVLVRVSVKKGPEYGGHFEEIGALDYRENNYWAYNPAPAGYYWQYRRNGKAITARVSPKTGRLLDVDKYWRRYRC